MQEWKAAEVGRLAQRVAATEKPRTARRKEFLCAEPGDVEPRGGAVTVANRQIDILACEIDVL